LKLKHVNPSKIKIPEVRVKGMFDEETKKLLADSMAGAGQISPIVCVEIEGELVLVDGENRLETARRANWPTIDVAVLEGDMTDVLTRNLFLDHIRGKHTPGQMLKVITELWKKYNLDSEQIAAKTGLKRDYLEQFQLLETLTPLVRQALEEDIIKLGHAVALAKIKDPVQQEVVFQQTMLYHWPVKELEAFVRQVQETVPAPVQNQAPAEPGIPVTLKCFYCGGDFDVSEVRNPNTCSECATVLIQSIARARAEIQAEKESKKNGEPPPK